MFRKWYLFLRKYFSKAKNIKPYIENDISEIKNDISEIDVTSRQIKRRGELIGKVYEEYNFKGIHVDKKTGLETMYENYSITIQLSINNLELLKEEFPNFSFYKCFSNYYNIGFNKLKT